MARFCTNCGSPMPDGAFFCTKCGFRLIQPGEQPEQKENTEPEQGTGQENTVPEQAPAENAGLQDYAPETPVKEKKPKMNFKLSKKLLIPIIAAVAALIVILVVVNINGKTIDLTKYVDIEFSGPSGYATASTDIDSDGLSMAVLKALGHKVDNASDLYSNFDLSLITDAAKATTVMSSMSVDLDKTENIANGDEVTATVTFTGNAKDLGLRIKDGTVKVKAEELPEAELVDPFDVLTVTFTGVDGYGDLELKENSNDFYFYADDYDYGKLKNGDTVKIIANFDEYSLLKDNKIATASEKTYTVSGLTEVEEKDVFEGVTVTFSGIDGYGEAELEDDGSFDDYYIYYYLDKDYELSNGDTVTITADFDEDYLSRNGIVAKASEKTVTVEGLKESEAIDIFADVEISYDGIAPFAYAYIDSFYDDNDIYYSFELDKTDYIAIGDKITVTASFDEDELARKGYTAASKTKEYTVGNIDAYATKIADLTDADLKTLQKVCEDFMANDLDSFTSDTFKHSESYMGCYIMTAKEESGYTGNIVVPVYQGKISDTSADHKVAETTVYYAYFIQEVYHKADGTLVYDENLQVFQPETGVDTSIGELYVYTDGKAMFEGVIKANSDICTYVMTDNLKQFGE